MGQYKDVFIRYEKKYLLEEEQYRVLLEQLKPYMKVDQYGRSVISNIYFDTPDHRLIRTSLEKPAYKEKLRLRSYGVANGETNVFVEVKKKYQGIVYKRRLNMSLDEAENYLYCGEEPTEDSQIRREVDWMFAYYKNLKPAMHLSYDRIAMFGMEDSNLRITFDSQILWREKALDLSKGAWGEPLLQEGQRLMEIKIAGAMPLWLSHMLDEMKIYPVSFSKYGNAYKASREAVQKRYWQFSCPA